MEESKTFKTFWLVVLSGFGFFVQFISAPFIARALTVFENGIYHQVVLVTDVFFLFLALGFHNVVLIYLRRTDYNKYEVFWTSFLFLKTVGLLGVITIYFSAPYIDMHYNANGQLTTLLRIYSVFLIFKLPMAATEAAFILFGRTKSIVKRNLILSIFNTCLLIFAVQYFKTVEALVYALTINSFTSYTISFLLVPKEFKHKIKLSRDYFNKQITDGFALGFNNIVGRLSIIIDKLIISSLMSPAVFAVYRNGAIEVPFFSSIYRTISNMAIPEMSHLLSINKSDKIVELKKKIIGSTALIVYPVMIFLVLFAKEFITIYLSDKYINSAPVFRIFALTLIFRINAHSDILMANRKYKTVIKSSIILLTVTALTSYILIYLYGIIGGALAYFAMVMTSTLLLLNFSAKSINRSLIDFFNMRDLLSISGVSISVAALIMILPINLMLWYNFLMVFVLYGIIVYTILLKFFITDLTVIKNILNKVNIKGHNLGHYFEKVFG